MARKDGNGGGTATMDPEQAALFPELDDANPDHKELMRRSRKYAKEKVSRDELLKTNKEEVEALKEKVVEQMHKCELRKFRHGDLTLEIVQGKEEVKLKFDTTDEDGDDE